MQESFQVKFSVYAILGLIKKSILFALPAPLYIAPNKAWVFNLFYTIEVPFYALYYFFFSQIARTIYILLSK